MFVYPTKNNATHATMKMYIYMTWLENLRPFQAEKNFLTIFFFKIVRYFVIISLFKILFKQIKILRKSSLCVLRKLSKDDSSFRIIFHVSKGWKLSLGIKTFNRELTATPDQMVIFGQERFK